MYLQHKIKKNRQQINRYLRGRRENISPTRFTFERKYFSVTGDIRS